MAAEGCRRGTRLSCAAMICGRERPSTGGALTRLIETAYAEIKERVENG